MTESGLVFGAGRDNHIRAWDSDTGKQLWSSRFGGNFIGSPVMYEMDGRQYLLVPAASTAPGGGRGGGGGRATLPAPDPSPTAAVCTHGVGGLRAAAEVTHVRPGDERRLIPPSSPGRACVVSRR